ncbi:maleylpyruvate isomerase family mycothiol-dependent enzyme [Kineosporia sp. NBRC 101731]|uniref:maleylpyruvate isomerase family mycothiol-dependent enzyme n=1 Tax=Kineosporia sp. NBRC 101731 TaxID=3032199 RepID=UPI00255286CE|nr:maleylpyruvate isomerase family mycothiol-dependent enzyme [Kineosporia sp. NBRC 101731]
MVNDLGLVRLGTAFFRRALDQLDDAELDAPSLLSGWSRRHLVAHVGYNARAVARLVSWADTGAENPMYASPRARAEEIDFGATLAPAALRHLIEHSAIDLDVRWRDLPANRWSFVVRTAQGRQVPVAQTLWMRTREVWLHAVDLRSGAQVEQVPVPVLRRLVGDVHAAWTTRGTGTGLVLQTTDGPVPAAWGAADPGRPDSLDTVTVTGSTPDLAAWATGRMDPARWEKYLDWSGGAPRPAPHWI